MPPSLTPWSSATLPGNGALLNAAERDLAERRRAHDAGVPGRRRRGHPRPRRGGQRRGRTVAAERWTRCRPAACGGHRASRGQGGWLRPPLGPRRNAVRPAGERLGVRRSSDDRAGPCDDWAGSGHLAAHLPQAARRPAPAAGSAHRAARRYPAASLSRYGHSGPHGRGAAEPSSGTVHRLPLLWNTGRSSASQAASGGRTRACRGHALHLPLLVESTAQRRRTPAARPGQTPRARHGHTPTPWRGRSVTPAGAGPQANRPGVLSRVGPATACGSPSRARRQQPVGLHGGTADQVLQCHRVDPGRSDRSGGEGRRCAGCLRRAGQLGQWWRDARRPPIPRRRPPRGRGPPRRLGGATDVQLRQEGVLLPTAQQQRRNGSSSSSRAAWWHSAAVCPQWSQAPQSHSVPDRRGPAGGRCPPPPRPRPDGAEAPGRAAPPCVRPARPRDPGDRAHSSPDSSGRRTSAR